MTTKVSVSLQPGGPKLTLAHYPDPIRRRPEKNITSTHQESTARKREWEWKVGGVPRLSPGNPGLQTALF